MARCARTFAAGCLGDLHAVQQDQRLSFNSLHKNLAWWAVMQITSKNHRIGGWVLAWDNTVLTLLIGYCPGTHNTSLHRSSLVTTDGISYFDATGALLISCMYTTSNVAKHFFVLY